jgi:sugar phosphate isomerase/epimerase
MNRANPISVLLTSLPLEFEQAVRQVAAMEFTHVDLVAEIARPPSHYEVLAESALTVSCCPIGRGVPEEQTLDTPDVSNRRAAVEAFQRQIADAALLGATHGYVISGKDSSPDGLARFAESCGILADFAAARMVKLCVEHIPGRALATAAATLDWLVQLGHANLFLLLDIGHCLITSENAAELIHRAGSRLGYVHFDDNDGIGDLHWALLTGKLTEANLRDSLEALPRAGYRGPLALELSPKNADPAAALKEGKALLSRLAVSQDA